MGPAFVPSLKTDQLRRPTSGTGRYEGIDDARSQGAAVLERLGLSAGSTAVARDLSGDTRQKLNLALALLGQPGLLLLDEPYQGFDHGTYLNFWDLVDSWRQEGKGVLIVTHLLAKLSRADRVVELSVPGRPDRAAGIAA